MFVPSLERRLELADLMRLPWALAQGKRMRSACDQGGHEIVVPSGGLALALEAGFQRGVGAREVEGNLAEQGQVPGGGTLAYATGIFVEPDVEHPVETVLDCPMASDGGGKLCRWQLAAGEIVADLGGDLDSAVDAADVLDRQHRRQARPTPRGGQRLEPGAGEDTPAHQPAVAI